jgi:hypothetical protein
VFVVRDGKVLLGTYPSRLTESVIEGLLAGGEAQTKALAEHDSGVGSEGKIKELVKGYHAAKLKNDIAAMESSLARMKEIDPKFPYVQFYGFELMVLKEQWAEAQKTLPRLASNPKFGMFTLMVVDKVADSPEAPESFRKMVADDLATRLGNVKVAMSEQTYKLARLQWSIGEKDMAIANVKRSVELAKGTWGIKNRDPLAAYEKFLAALEKGEMPARDQMDGWMKEAKAAIPPQEKPALPPRPTTPQPAKAD